MLATETVPTAPVRWDIRYRNLPHEPDSLNPVAETHGKVKGKNQLHKVVLRPPRAHDGMCAHVCTRTLIVMIIMNKSF